MSYINTVLVVDDSDLVRSMINFTIKKAGYNILSSVDGSDALELFDGRDIDLVITDLNMPNMDGLTLIKEIRLKKGYQYTPIVLFLPEKSEAECRRNTSKGPTMVFDKDNIKDKLIPAVKKLIGNGQV